MSTKSFTPNLSSFPRPRPRPPISQPDFSVPIYAAIIKHSRIVKPNDPLGLQNIPHPTSNVTLPVTATPAQMKATIAALGDPYPNKQYIPVVELAILFYIARHGMPSDDSSPINLAVIVTPVIYHALSLLVWGATNSDTVNSVSWAGLVAGDNPRIRQFYEERMKCHMRVFGGLEKLKKIDRSESCYQKLMEETKRDMIRSTWLNDHIIREWNEHGRPKGNVVQQYFSTMLEGLMDREQKEDLKAMLER